MQITHIHIEDIQSLFQKQKEVERDSIIKFIRKKSSVESSTYLLNKLIKNKIIQRTGYGKYALWEREKLYVPQLDDFEKEIYQLVKKEKPLLETCVWRDSIINEFTLHQPGIFFIFVEVERIGVDAVFDLLRDNYPNVYKQPTAEVFDNYVTYQNNAIIVIPLISEAPLTKVDDIPTISLEKLLVDLVRETKLHEAVQGAELTYVFREAINKYTINKTKLLRYASRRGVKNLVEKRIEQATTTEYNTEQIR
jgi:hypothetical protein